MTRTRSILARHHATALCAALLAAAWASPAVAVPTLAITGPSAVAPGQAFSLTISASGLADLYAYQFDIGFDATLFSTTAVSEGGFLATAGTTFFDPGSIDNQAGTVSLVLGTLIGPDPGASGSGTLLTVRLAALNLPVPPAGSGRFSLLNVQVYDAALNPVSVLLHDHVTAVPEPASWALALAGAAALGAWCRRQRRPGSATTALAA